MRLLAIAFLTICAAHAQIYNLQTIAGGGFPENTPCTAADLGALAEGLAADGAGNLFIPVPLYNVVVRCDVSTGTLTRVAGTGVPGFSNGQNVPATSVRLTSPVAVAVDAAGNLYIAETGRVRKVSGGIVTTVAGNGIAGFSGDGGPAGDAEVSPVAIAVDPAGNVYISDGIGYRIRKISNGVITTIAGVGEGVAGATGEDVPAVTAQIGESFSIAVDSAGTLYLALGNGGVRKVSNGMITTVTGAVRAVGVAVDPSGNLYIMSTGGAYRFSAGALTPIRPADDTLTGAAIAVDAAGNVYFPDGYSDPYDFITLDFRMRIRKVSNGAITTVAGGGYKTSENGPPAAAQLGVPTGVAVDSAGDLYFAESNGNRIRKLSNGVLTTVAGNGTLGFAGDGGPATTAQLAGPTGIAFDSHGALYIADTYNHRVRKVVNGVITTVAGNGTRGNSGAGGPALAATLFRPAAVAVDTAGTLYITDQGNQVRKVSNGVITAAACDGIYGYVGDNVPALSAQCKYPGALAVDVVGNLYFADTGNGYVREVTPDGIIHNVAGIGKQVGDGIPAVNAFVSPNSLTADAAGNLYIGDNGAIRKVTNGMIDTIAGGGYLPTGNDFARSAALGSIPGIVVDPAGKIYFSDSGHQTIRVASPQSGMPVSVSSIRNAASNLQSWIAPGEVIVITGSGLGPAGLTMGALTVDGVFDTQVAGSSVQINGVPAPMIYTSAQQVAAVVPYGAVAAGPPLLNGVTVTYQGSVSATAKIAGAQWQLELFTGNASGTGQAAAVNQDGAINSAPHPAAPGSVISLYATGEGAATPNGIDGKPASAPLPIPSTKFTVTIGGQTVTPDYAGGAPGEIAGLMQINVRIPANLAPETVMPVTVQAPGYASSQPGVTIAIGN
jgi:trimeric autotransporter adhesin